MEKFDDEFTLVYKAYYLKIRKLCFGYTHSLEQAEDLAQETFLSAWKYWGNFKWQSSRNTWIYRIAVNKCLSHIKVEQRRPDVLEEVIEHPATAESNNEEVKQIYSAISKLEKVDRLLITMYLDELSYKEISEALGIRENTIAVKIHRIKKQLTKIYNDYERV